MRKKKRIKKRTEGAAAPKFLIKEGEIFKTVALDETQTKLLSETPIKYVRDWSNGSTANTGNHWVEVEVKKADGTNVARGLTATTDYSSGISSANYITDGSANTNNYAGVGSELQHVKLELAEPTLIKDVKVWHYFSDSRTYHETKTEVSVDGIEWIVVFDSAVSGEYAEASAGKNHDLSLIEVPVYTLQEVTGITGAPTPEQFTTNGFEKDAFKYVLGLYEVPANIQLMCYSQTPVAPVVKLKAAKKSGDIIKMNYDINMNAENIASIRDSILEFTKTDTDGMIRIIFSFDSGLTWKSLDATTLVDVDIADHTAIETNGLTETEFHDLTVEQLAVLFMPKQIRYAIYLKNADPLLDNKISKLKVLYNQQ